MTELVIKGLEKEQIVEIAQNVCNSFNPKSEDQGTLRFFIDAPEKQSMFFRDAAFSLNISVLNQANPLVSEKIARYLSIQKESLEKIKTKKASMNKRLSK